MLAEQSDRIALLKLHVEEEHHFLVEHQKRVSFYTSIVTAILGATVAGTINVEDTTHFLLLQIGPLLVFGVSRIAKDGTYRLYQRFLESITIRAKIEQELGLTTPEASDIPNRYWEGESIVPPRHVLSRRASSSSSAFIKQHGNLGYHASTRRLLTTFQLIAIALSGGLGALWWFGG
ncbi:MAG: hypothetical protein RQ757_12455 [Pseudomonadales bacterium]|nr:hypothetical protein [Pseudomonadales bacterium]